MKSESKKIFAFAFLEAGRAFVHISLAISMIVVAVFGGAALADSSPPGKLYTVNAHKVHMYCTGSGSPSVILVSGLGGTSLEWTRVQQQLSRHTRVCSYDRPGYGWSELSTAPRNARTMARELNELLTVSEESGPYILVGHSLGGHIIRLFANEFAGNVAGLVLVDAAHEDMFSLLAKYRGRSDIPKQSRSLVDSNRGASVPESFPEEFKALAIEQMSQFQTRFAIASEMRQFGRSADEVRHSSALPAVPVTVISRDSRILAHEGRNGLVAREWANLQTELHKRLADSEHIIARDSGHYPHLDRPELVSSSILDLVRHSGREWLSKL